MTVGAENLRCKLRKRNDVIDTFTVYADPHDGAALRQILRTAVERRGGNPDDPIFTLDVRSSSKTVTVAL